MYQFAKLKPSLKTSTGANPVSSAIMTLSKFYKKCDKKYFWSSEWGCMIYNDIKSIILDYQEKNRTAPNIRLNVGIEIFEELKFLPTYEFTDSPYLKIFNLTIPLEINWSLDADEIQYNIADEIPF
jgi:hypothetical protein